MARTRLTLKEASFKLADALMGMYQEQGTVSRYMEDEEFEKCLQTLKALDPNKFKEEIEIYL